MLFCGSPRSFFPLIEFLYSESAPLWQKYETEWNSLRIYVKSSGLTHHIAVGVFRTVRQSTSLSSNINLPRTSPGLWFPIHVALRVIHFLSPTQAHISTGLCLNLPDNTCSCIHLFATYTVALRAPEDRNSDLVFARARPPSEFTLHLRSPSTSITSPTLHLSIALHHIIQEHYCFCTTTATTILKPLPIQLRWQETGALPASQKMVALPRDAKSAHVQRGTSRPGQLIYRTCHESHLTYSMSSSLANKSQEPTKWHRHHGYWKR